MVLRLRGPSDTQRSRPVHVMVGRERPPSPHCLSRPPNLTCVCGRRGRSALAKGPCGVCGPRSFSGDSRVLAYVGASADPWSAVTGWRALLAARCGLTEGGGCTPLDLVAWDLIVSLCICLFSIFLAYFRAFRPFSPIGFFGRIASVCGGFSLAFLSRDYCWRGCPGALRCRPGACWHLARWGGRLGGHLGSSLEGS